MANPRHWMFVYSYSRPSWRCGIPWWGWLAPSAAGSKFRWAAEPSPPCLTPAQSRIAAPRPAGHLSPDGRQNIWRERVSSYFWKNCIVLKAKFYRELQGWCCKFCKLHLHKYVNNLFLNILFGILPLVMSGRSSSDVNIILDNPLDPFGYLHKLWIF